MIISNQGNLKNSLSNHVVSTAFTDVQARSGARTSAARVMTTLVYHIDSQTQTKNTIKPKPKVGS